MEIDGHLSSLVFSNRHRDRTVLRQGVPPQLFEELSERPHFLSKERPFRGGNPFQAKIALIHAEQPQDFVRIFNHLLTLHITFQVMAVTDVSP
jgi:hypothetical protein